MKKGGKNQDVYRGREKQESCRKPCPPPLGFRTSGGLRRRKARGPNGPECGPRRLLLRPRSSFLRLCSRSRFQRIPVETHLPSSPGAWRQPAKQETTAAAPARDRQRRLLGQPSPLHVGGRRAPLGRAAPRPALPSPAPRPPARAPDALARAALRDSEDTSGGAGGSFSPVSPALR